MDHVTFIGWTSLIWEIPGLRKWGTLCISVIIQIDEKDGDNTPQEPLYQRVGQYNLDECYGVYSQLH